ncbi:lysozyme inhibitor LprI family protein [Pararoseomonas indoligenes]|uniref:DUF1311 domain-containing protein n=1 Tax=Roseomonas indoligenes TaxID=2820811 RepID=A0A940N4J1_9PROT|nr:lysozyme inhibitor LprI family protein [Pararoseomonas indoligenes]MBP0496479.1 DUF1311 domain-containing protein [Pararoseomonas indoligenes]
MKRLCLQHLLVFVVLLAGPVAQAASFDCSQARSSVERMICGDPALSALDEQLAAAYRTATSAGNSPQIRTAQREWMTERNRCAAPSCVRSAYERRIAELSASEGRLEDPSQGQAGTPGAIADGKYCVFGSGNSYDMLLARQGTDGALNFALSSWAPNGSHFGVAGLARRVSSGWRYEEGMRSADPTQRCVVVIARAMDGAFRISTVEGARCEALAGHGATLEGTLVIPAASRVGDAPATFSAGSLMQIGCDRPARSGRARR